MIPVTQDILGIVQALLYVAIVLSVIFAIRGVYQLKLWLYDFPKKLAKHFGKTEEQQRRLEKDFGLFASKRIFKLRMAFIWWHGRSTFLLLPGAIAVTVMCIALRLNLDKFKPAPSRVILGTFLCILVAALLYLLKTSALRTYAVLEGIFAVGFCAERFSRMRNTEEWSVILTILTSLYLMVRALDNYFKGLEKARSSATEREKMAIAASNEASAVVNASRPSAESASSQSV